MVWCRAVLPASSGTWQTDNRGSPGTWEILSFPQPGPGRSTGSTNSRPRRRGIVRRGAKRTSARCGTAKRRQRSAAGGAAGSHSALIYLRSWRTGPSPEPGGGKRGVGSWNRCWETRRMHRNSTNVSTKQERIAELAKQSPQMGFTSLAHLMDIDWLQGSLPAYPQGRRRGRGRSDRRRYEQNLEANLQVAARPGQVRHVPGSAGAAGAYSQGRLDDRDSPDRHPDVGGQGPAAGGRHVAGADLRAGLPWPARMASGRDDQRTRRWRPLAARRWTCQGGWVLEVDIRKFFDTLDHAHLRAFLQRVRDGVLLRLIGKWLKAGVMEDGA